MREEPGGEPPSTGATTGAEEAPARRPGELLFALVLLGFSAFAFREAYGISGFSGLTTGGVLPMLAAGAMVVSAGAITLRAARERHGLNPAAVIRYLLPFRLVWFAALVTAYAAAIPWAGFLPSSAVFLFASIALLWRRGVLPALAVSGVSVVLIYLVFRQVFQVVMPTGVLWQ